MSNIYDVTNTDIKVEVSEFKGQMRVDIRKWYVDKSSNEWVRTAKGINMSVKEWEELKNQMSAISSHVEGVLKT